MRLSPSTVRQIDRAVKHQLATALAKVDEFPEFSKGITRLALVEGRGQSYEVEVAIRPADLPWPTGLLSGPSKEPA